MCFQVSNLVKEQIWSLLLLGTHQCIQGDACCCLVQYQPLCKTQLALVHCYALLCLLFVEGIVIVSIGLTTPPQSSAAVLHSSTMTASWQQQRLQVTALVPVNNTVAATFFNAPHSSCCYAQATNHNNCTPTVTCHTHNSRIPAQVDGRLPGCKLGPGCHLQRQPNPVRMSQLCPRRNQQRRKVAPGLRLHTVHSLAE